MKETLVGWRRLFRRGGSRWWEGQLWSRQATEVTCSNSSFLSQASPRNLTQCALESHADGNQKLFPCEVCGRCFAADVLVNIKTFSRCVSLESNELSSQRGGNGAKIKDRCGEGREEKYVTYGCQAWRTLRQADNATFRSDPINRGLPEHMPIGMVLAQTSLS